MEKRMIYYNYEKEDDNINGTAELGAIYGLGMPGALVYFIQHADSVIEV